MSSNLFAYKFSNGEWLSANDINESDVGVIIDTSREAIWFFSGKFSSARKRSNARELLSNLLNQYSSYVMNIVADDTPDDILVKLEDLKEEYYKRRLANLNYDIRKVSNAFFYLNLFACLLLIVVITFSIMLIFGGSTTFIDNYSHFSMPFENYILQIFFLTAFTLTPFIFFSINTLITIFTNNIKLAMLSLTAALTSFIGFFILRIWDLTIFYQIIGWSIYVRVDVLILFILNINIFGILSLLFGLYLLIIGQKKMLKTF
jgi:hypothetical protein